MGRRCVFLVRYFGGCEKLEKQAGAEFPCAKVKTFEGEHGGEDANELLAFVAGAILHCKRATRKLILRSCQACWKSDSFVVVLGSLWCATPNTVLGVSALHGENKELSCVA